MIDLPSSSLLPGAAQTEGLAWLHPAGVALQLGPLVQDAAAPRASFVVSHA